MKKQILRKVCGDGMGKNDLALLKITRVGKGTTEAERLLQFVEDFSWEEVKAHVTRMLRDWDFSDWETPFAAWIDDNIVGMTTIRKTDYYPLPDICPWISCIFVTEEYRRNRISGKLIDFANAYAAEIGFCKTYIPSNHIGLYEKYGYRYLEDITNYGNGIDRLYVKEL